MAKDKFLDKVIWVTGASSGIGEACVYEFFNLGAKLIISGRNEERLQEIKQKLGDDSRVEVLPFDLGETDKLPCIVKEALSKYNQVDMLFNNGGISQRSYLCETPVSVDREIMEVDYFSNVILSKEILPHMLERGSGHILATSSISGCFGFPLRSSYSAAKHALYGFYETMRAELHDKGIKVTLITPGFVKTNVSINAIGKNGVKHGKLDKGQEKGISPEKCARKIVKAIKKDKVEALIGGYEVIMVYLRRIFPRLFFKIVTKVKVK